MACVAGPPFYAPSSSPICAYSCSREDACIHTITQTNALLARTCLHGRMQRAIERERERERD